MSPLTVPSFTASAHPPPPTLSTLDTSPSPRCQLNRMTQLISGRSVRAMASGQQKNAAFVRQPVPAGSIRPRVHRQSPPLRTSAGPLVGGNNQSSPPFMLLRSLPDSGYGAVPAGANGVARIKVGLHKRLPQLELLLPKSIAGDPVLCVLWLQLPGLLVRPFVAAASSPSSVSACRTPTDRQHPTAPLPRIFTRAPAGHRRRRRRWQRP